MTQFRRATRLVGVRLTPTGTVKYFDPGEEDLDLGALVVVEDEVGRHEATVVIAPSQLVYSDIRGELAPILGVVGKEQGRKG